MIKKYLFLFLSLLCLHTATGQSINFKDLQMLSAFDSDKNDALLKKKGFTVYPVVKEEGRKNMGYGNNQKEFIYLAYDNKYYAEGGIHVYIEYDQATQDAYNKLVAAAKSNGFRYSPRNKQYSRNNGTYIFDILKPEGKIGSKFRITYSHHIGKEVSPLPPQSIPDTPLRKIEEYVAVPFGMDDALLADSLQYVTGLPYIEHCDTSGIFWRAVKRKENMVHYLIYKLDDTTVTNAPVFYFGGYYTLADVAYVALQEIVQGIPTFELLGIPFDKEGCGYCAYWQYLRKDIGHRKKFKKAVTDSYITQHFVWVKNDHILTGECSVPHPNGGHFVVKPE